MKKLLSLLSLLSLTASAQVAGDIATFEKRVTAGDIKLYSTPINNSFWGTNGVGNFTQYTANAASTLLDGATDPFLRTSAAGTGDVVGPASSIDDNIALFDGLTGKLIQDAGINLSEVVEEDPGAGVGLIESGVGVSPIVLKNLKNGAGTEVVNNTGSVQVDIDFTAADRYYYSDGSALPVEGVITTAGRNLLDDPTTSDQRTTLGLGTAAVANTGTGASDVPTITDADARYLTPFQPTLLSVAGPLATSSTSLANVTGAVFNSVPTGFLEVQFMIDYDAAALGSGAYFAIDGTATQNYLGVNVLYNTTQGDNPSRSSIAFNSGGASTSCRTTTGNIATVNVRINVTVSGTIQLRYATESAGNAITIQSLTGFMKKAG
jgi:hypothetical protein